MNNNFKSKIKNVNTLFFILKLNESVFLLLYLCMKHKLYRNTCLHLKLEYSVCFLSNIELNKFFKLTKRYCDFYFDIGCVY